MKIQIVSRMVITLMILCILMCGCTTVSDTAVESAPSEQVSEDMVWEGKPENPGVPEENITTEDVKEESSEMSKGNQSIKDTPDFVCSGSLDVYNISTESYLRTGGRKGDLNQLGSDEYYSYVLHLQYNGPKTLTWKEAYVVVDNGEPWYWAEGSLPSGYCTDFHIYHCNMVKLGEGMHTLSWYMDGKEVFRDSFILTKDLNWKQITDLPTAQEIKASNNTAALRSPYMAVWLSIPSDVRYTEYTIDFKSDHFPRGSYYSLGNWCMDYSSLESRYESVTTDGISGYAGFQNIHNGEHLGIMSFWDVYCKNASGQIDTIRPTPVYPKNPYKSGEFGGEGTGAQCMSTYNWEENHWYRFHLRCTESTKTGNTVVDFGVYDLETGTYTLICSYDIGFPGSAFKGSIAVFLENYLTEYAGEIRTLEVRRPQYKEESTGKWHTIREGDLYPNGSAGISSYAGSYDYGMDGDRLWIMTTGVGNNSNDSYGRHLVFG